MANLAILTVAMPMKLFIFLTIFLHLAVYGFSQLNEFENYYPETQLYKKLKVKNEFDTIASPPNHHMKKEYDILGRQTGMVLYGG